MYGRAEFWQSLIQISTVQNNVQATCEADKQIIKIYMKGVRALWLSIKGGVEKWWGNKNKNFKIYYDRQKRSTQKY